MKNIQSKYDADTEYKVTAEYVTVMRDGESMKIPFRQIPNVMLVFCKEIQAELMDIYNRKYLEAVCPICGKPFEKGNKNQKFCSDECRKEQNKRRSQRVYFEQKETEKICPICSKPFSPPNGRFKYCSGDCKKRAIANRYAVTGKGGQYKPKKDQSVLTRLTQEARSKGLTYGQLQAQKYIAQMKGVLE